MKHVADALPILLHARPSSLMMKARTHETLLYLDYADEAVSVRMIGNSFVVAWNTVMSVPECLRYLAKLKQAKKPPHLLSTLKTFNAVSKQAREIILSVDDTHGEVEYVLGCDDWSHSHIIVVENDSILYREQRLTLPQLESLFKGTSILENLP